MSDPIEALEQFYKGCDRAEAPPRLSLPSRLFLRLSGTFVGGLSPFAVSFALVAAALAIAGAASNNAPAVPAYFPQTLRSAGLSQVEPTPPAPDSRILQLVRSWRV